MNSYRTLSAWKCAHRALLLAHRALDAAYHPRSRSLFDQLRRAAISIEANIVEGYALNTTPMFKRHLRIALGSAAEAECLLRAAIELDYLRKDAALPIAKALDGAIRALFGLLRKLPVVQPVVARKQPLTAHRSPS